MDSDLGDTWAWYYKFLLQHGTDVSSFRSMITTKVDANQYVLQEKREDVIAKCVVSEPKHGEIWQSVAKDPANAHLGTEEILKLVVAKLS